MRRLGGKSPRASGGNSIFFDYTLMLWQIKPFSHRCCVSSHAFAAGETYVSYLAIDDNNELLRFDVLEAREEEFELTGQLLCRWRQVYKKEPEKDDSARKQRETAEGLFLSLYEDLPEEESPEEAEEARRQGEIMKKFLALLLERKRILRPRGNSPDGLFRLMEHARSRNIFPVPAGSLSPEELVRISERLNALVG
jgi:hypothetical protein